MTVLGGTIASFFTVIASLVLFRLWPLIIFLGAYNCDACFGGAAATLMLLTTFVIRGRWSFFGYFGR